MLRKSSAAAATLLLLVACTREPPATKEPLPTTPGSASGAQAAPASALHIGAAIATNAAMVPLADVAKNPSAFKDKTITTAGTVTAVCQNMGCWMEIKDVASEAHIKMAGHSFFVPKTAAGHKARVQAKVVPSDDENAECNEEAKKQMGHAVAKVQLEATGVELD